MIIQKSFYLNVLDIMRQPYIPIAATIANMRQYDNPTTIKLTCDNLKIKLRPLIISNEHGLIIIQLEFKVDIPYTNNRANINSCSDIKLSCSL